MTKDQLSLVFILEDIQLAEKWPRFWEDSIPTQPHPAIGFFEAINLSSLKNTNNSGGFQWENQWLFLVPLKGGIGSIFHPPEGKDYKWYISGIYCQLGDYMPPTTS